MVNSFQTAMISENSVPIFTGAHNESFIDFLKRYELHAEAFNWTEGRKRVTLLLAMQHHAQNVVDTLTDTDKESYSNLRNSLSIKLVPVSQARFSSQALSAIKYEDYGDITRYAAEVMRLAKGAYPTMPQEHRLLVIKTTLWRVFPPV